MEDFTNWIIHWKIIKEHRWWKGHKINSNELTRPRSAYIRQDVEVKLRKQLHIITKRDVVPKLTKDQKPLTVQSLQCNSSIKMNFTELTHQVLTIGQWRSMRNASFSLVQLTATRVPGKACFWDWNHFHPCFSNPISPIKLITSITHTDFNYPSSSATKITAKNPAFFISHTSKTHRIAKSATTH